VRVIDELKEQRGVMSLNDALALARQKGLDLVEIAATATPPVCRIVDYGKFLYEESKRAKDAKQTTGKMKELQISPAIDPHDLGVKLNHAIGFLCEDMKVRVKMRFRGRQNAHKDLGFALMNRFVKELAPYATPDTPPKMMGDRDVSVLLSPLPRNKRAKPPDQAEPPAESSTKSQE
jgi:translation initiation factor IF-3